jgi:heptosyltransferase-3
MANEKHFLISRTDSIGDVVLTLPMCAAIRKKYPHAKISFLARTYTVPVVRMCEHVDDIINWDEMVSMSPSDQIALLQEKNIDVIVHVFPRKEIIWLAKRARIPLRIATGRRWYTLMKCNKLVFFSRKKSNLHEAQLNMKLLAPIGHTTRLFPKGYCRYVWFDKISDLTRETCEPH